MKCIGDASRTVQELSFNEKVIVTHLQHTQTRSGYGPEIGRALGMSRGWAYHYLNKLKEKGIVKQGIQVVRGRGRPTSRWMLT